MKHHANNPALYSLHPEYGVRARLQPCRNALLRMNFLTAVGRRAAQAKRHLPGAPPRSSERGYILLVLSMFVALLAIGLMQALPTALVQTQREREEELIFRGEQYSRAVQNYVRKFGRYPSSMDDLEDTNGVRFLRRRYQDPITGEEEWRMIHIGPGGTFPDSKNSTTPPGQPGGTGLTPSVAGSEPRGFSEQPSQFEAVSGFGGAEAPPQIPPAAGGDPGSGENPEQVPDALRPTADPSANPAQQPRAAGVISASGAAQQPAAFGGGGIAGVASNSTDPSIKVYNGYLQYDEWEFIYNYQADQFGMAAVARATGGAVPGAVQPGLQPGVGAPPGAPGAPPPGVMSPRPGNQVPGVPFPAPFGGPNVPPRFPAGQFPGGVPGAPSGAFPGAQPGGFGQQPGAFPGTQPGGFGGAQPGTAPGTQQPQSPFAPRPFPGFGQPSTPSPSPSPGFGGAQPPRTNQPGFGSQPTQPGQGFPTSPIPGFPSNPQPRR